LKNSGRRTRHPEIDGSASNRQCTYYVGTYYIPWKTFIRAVHY